ncbi:MAG TPA: PKD domain-containing protein, partial [Anaerolineales bacterium]|nr:PKD domain-containing protein [Anaerolineales bacterium]
VCQRQLLLFRIKEQQRFVLIAKEIAKMTGKKIFQAVIVLMLLLGAPVATFAQDSLRITVTTDVSCDQVDFLIDVQGGLAPYTMQFAFGDSESFQDAGLASETIKVTHYYPSQGEYEWSLIIADNDSLLGEAEGVVAINGPVVILNSDPMPPLLTIESEAASIVFWAEVSGGVGPYTYTWDLDEIDGPDTGLSGVTEPYTYSTGGKHPATVWVSDSCDLSHTDTLTVVVVDPEDDPGDACHPTAKKIADAVNSLLPYRADDTYTCEDIFNIFEGALLGNHVGFGRLWHAYQLTQTIPDLTWEEIRDWKLDGSSWGALTQLNRFADTLDEFGIRNLFDLVVNGDNTVGEIRTAARAAVRYEADFEDALARLSDGAKSGELGQFYKLAQALEMDPAALDEYLNDGVSLSELRHSAKMAERTGGELDAILDAKSFDLSWGDIGQAYKLADDEHTALDILAMEGGVQKFREQLRDAEKLAREEERTAREDARTAARKEGLDEKTAARLSEQYSYTGDINALLTGVCEGSWGCVRKKLKDMDQAQVEGVSDKDTRTAERLFAQYGVDMNTIWSEYKECGGDWNCVRSELRDMTREDKKDK